MLGWTPAPALFLEVSRQADDQAREDAGKIVATAEFFSRVSGRAAFSWLAKFFIVTAVWPAANVPRQKTETW
jgi:hypothetical protein